MAVSVQTEYVVGFAFCGSSVLLIRKNRPEWQAGLLNGIGGHVESYETPRNAMAREFHEETGVWLPEREWTRYATITGKDYLISFYYAWLERPDFLAAHSTTDELLVIRDLHVRGWDSGVVSNLSWLIPLARDMYAGPFNYDTVDVFDRGHRRRTH